MRLSGGACGAHAVTQGIILRDCRQVSQGLNSYVWAGHACILVGSGLGWKLAGDSVLTDLWGVMRALCCASEYDDHLLAMATVVLKETKCCCVIASAHVWLLQHVTATVWSDAATSPCAYSRMS